jgi:four helix bundle protein
LVRAIYGLCNQPALAKDYGLKDQIRRAAVSGMSNLAEGFERTHAIEKIQLYKVARASAGEVRSLLYVIEDQELVEAGLLKTARRMVEQTGSLITGLIRSSEKYVPKR